MKSCDFAIKFNIKNQNIVAHINKNKELFIDLGELKSYKLDSSEKGGRPETGYELNDLHIKFLITLLKNNIIINSVKKDLISNNFNIELFKKKPEYGYVYVIKNDNGFKIGSSISPYKRINCISTQQGKKVEIVLISDKRLDYKIKELELHKLFQKKRKIGEYFDLNINDLDKITCNLYDTSPNNLKFAITKFLYDYDRENFYKLYLIDLGYKLEGKKTTLYILNSTIEIARNILEKEYNGDIEKTYLDIKNKIKDIIDLIFTIN